MSIIRPDAAAKYIVTLCACGNFYWAFCTFAAPKRSEIYRNCFRDKLYPNWHPFGRRANIQTKTHYMYLCRPFVGYFIIQNNSD